MKKRKMIEAYFNSITFKDVQQYIPKQNDVKNINVVRDVITKVFDKCSIEKINGEYDVCFTTKENTLINVIEVYTLTKGKNDGHVMWVCVPFRWMVKYRFREAMKFMCYFPLQIKTLLMMRTLNAYILHTGRHGIETSRNNLIEFAHFINAIQEQEPLIESLYTANKLMLPSSFLFENALQTLITQKDLKGWIAFDRALRKEGVVIEEKLFNDPIEKACGYGFVFRLFRNADHDNIIDFFPEVIAHFGMKLKPRTLYGHCDFSNILFFLITKKKENTRVEDIQAIIEIPGFVEGVRQTLMDSDSFSSFKLLFTILDNYELKEIKKMIREKIYFSINVADYIEEMSLISKICEAVVDGKTHGWQ